MLQGKEILLGVSGSIAAYKAAELARLLVRSGAGVQVLLTEAACQFVAPLTFFALTGRQAFSQMFTSGPEVATAHIALAREADLVVVAPATARTIARVAHGLADDLLSTAVIAADSPVVIAPAMNVQMYAHPAVQENIERLRSWPGYFVAPPAAGELACGEYGLGRLEEPSSLIAFCQWVLAGGKSDLTGQKVVVTAGPTCEDIDPVRFLTNRSSGKMGYALAHAAARRGADVTLISGVTPLETPPGCLPVPVRSAAQMAEAVRQHLPPCSILLMSAAVADYRPAHYSSQKMKKAPGDLALPLERTEDILASLPPNNKRITVGFAAETESLLENAQSKLQRKHLDLIVANNVAEEGSGFASETNKVTLLAPNQDPQALPLMSKAQVAEAILDRVASLLPRT